MLPFSFFSWLGLGLVQAAFLTAALTPSMTPMMSDSFMIEEILAIDAHFAARPLAEQDAVTGLDVESDDLALLVARARTDGEDFAFHGLFLGRVGNDDTPGGLLLGFNPADHHPVVKRTEFHRLTLHVCA